MHTSKPNGTASKIYKTCPMCGYQCNGEDRLTGSASCPGHCLYRDNLAPCPEQCECAFVPDIIQIILQWPKAERAESAVVKMKVHRPMDHSSLGRASGHGYPVRGAN